MGGCEETCEVIIMEYTLISIVVLLASLYYALAVVRLPEKHLLIAVSISVFFQLIFDNYTTSLGLWSFDFTQTLGLAVPIIPLENLLFGAALAISTIASWERIRK
jgi:lycopene cyclase domain-containing protein